jgi:hypothetical protein
MECPVHSRLTLAQTPGQNILGPANNSCSCETGYYGELAETFHCVKCPAKSTTRHRGATSAQDCACIEGTFKHHGTCLTCVVNSFLVQSNGMEGGMDKACACNGGFYGVTAPNSNGEDTMTCEKCEEEKMSVPGSKQCQV